MEKLKNKSCVPCREGAVPFTKHVTDTFLRMLGNDWQVNNQGHLYKAFKFKDFMGAMTFANKVAVIAEAEGHHPDLLIRWGACVAEIWTHKIDGLTESDFILGAKIEAIG
ncbi:MAG: 4a-hydroxytetrahydrobiopterin dehydratase [Gammaproteobacteria bacterium]|jgi:4a-hydroxytetrahydrobiopterin dehydratase|nr:4a-hydroxytetrahydrobiopterin dehydratase [Gammaproteobacteria bacterium]